MVRPRKINFLYVVLVLILAGCGGSGNNATVSGGGSATNTAAQQKIVFAGGSTIARGNWSSYFGIPIVNDGVQGRESWQLVQVIDGYVASKPDKIFIMIGVNNILSRHEGVLVSDISTIIDRIRIDSPKTQIFILSMIPVKDDFARALIEVYNNQIYSLCNGKNVKFINVYGLFINANKINLNYYLSDGVHLNDAGYQVLANAIRSYVLS